MLNLQPAIYIDPFFEISHMRAEKSYQRSHKINLLIVSIFALATGIMLTVLGGLTFNLPEMIAGITILVGSVTAITAALCIIYKK